MNYILEREVKTNPFNIGIGITSALCVFFIFGILNNRQLDETNLKLWFILFIIVMQVAIVFFLYFGNRRYLRKIEIDFEKEILKTQSIIKSVNNEYEIREINEIKLIDSQGFGNTTKGFRNKNLVIRVNSKIQPQIFEVRDEDINKIAEEVINKIAAR